MAEPESKPASDEQAARPPGSRAKRAAIAVVFSVILLIPRLRRLRRKPMPWTFVRIATFATGAGLVWRYARGHATPEPQFAPGISSLLFGIVLAAFGLLVGSRPESKSLDAVARELGALILLNGGTFAAGDAVKLVPHAAIAVGIERIIVLDDKHETVAEIPVSAIRQISACAAPSVQLRTGRPPAWRLELEWESAGRQTSRFIFEGFFAEHLTRVAEQTIASQWKKALPVLK